MLVFEQKSCIVASIHVILCCYGFNHKPFVVLWWCNIGLSWCRCLNIERMTLHCLSWPSMIICIVNILPWVSILYVLTHEAFVWLSLQENQREYMSKGSYVMSGGYCWHRWHWCHIFSCSPLPLMSKWERESEEINFQRLVSGWRISRGCH